VRELTVAEFVSLDGFAAGPGHDPDFALGYEGPEFASYEQQVLSRSSERSGLRDLEFGRLVCAGV